jgi:hypothetical protein
MNDPQELTLEALRVRIGAAGITVAEHRLTLVQKLLNDALAPLRTLDSRTIKTLEPAVTFAPLQEGHDE